MTLPNNYLKLGQLCVAKGCIESLGDEAYYPLPIAVNTYESSANFYNQLGSLQIIIQKLLSKVEKDDQVIDYLLSMSGNDGYLNFLKQIRKETKNRKNIQNFLTLCRCDYFLDEQAQSPKLIEYNNMQVGMFNYSGKMSASHRLWSKADPCSYFSNETTKKFVECVVEHYQVRGLKGLFLFMISSNEGETLTQQLDIEMGLMEAGIETKRVKYLQLYNDGQIDEKGDLHLNGELVSFAYFRSGFLMKQYQQVGPIENAIEARVMLAGSNVTCVPSLNMEILNTKFAQSYITRPDIMRKYLLESEAQELEKTLVEIYSLEDKSQHQINDIVCKVEKSPNSWVLKPNMEGGGNNLYKQKVLPKLQQFQKYGAQNFILMKLIEHIPVYNNETLFMGKKLIRIRCNYELSRFGLISEIGGHVVQNLAEGYLIRTREEGKCQSDYYHGHDAYAVWRRKKE